MWGIKSQQIRQRLDSVFAKLGDARLPDLDKMQELWAVMSDMQLWMQDIETAETIRADAAMQGIRLGKEL